MAPLRILIIVENLPVPFDRRVWSEATTLAKAGYQVSVICPKAKGATASFEIIDNVHIFRHPLPMEAKGGFGYLIEYCSALFWEFLLSLKVLYRRGFDVIHACNPPDLIFLIGAFYKLLLGKRFVFDHHDINPELYEAKFGKRDFLWRMMIRLERWTFSVADISIATNESYRSIAIERNGMCPDRVFVVRSGPNVARVRTVPPDDRWKKGRKFLVAYVGVIGKQEGLDLLLESIKYIREVRNRADIQFVIVGGGPELEATRRLAKEIGVDDLVTFTGRVDDQTLFSALSTSDVCVNPDRPNEMNDKSTMNKIMEYMALGKPIVQFNLTEGRYSAQDASLYAANTDTADFGEKILKLLDDAELRARMGEFGRVRVRDQLAWNHEEPKLLAAYNSLQTRFASR
jgi:glycosyltransferase involved in cell wall biosynthesis